VDDELAFHRVMRERDQIQAAIDPGVRRTLLTIAGKRDRETRVTQWLEETWTDARLALRQMRCAPGFAAVAVLTLALGIGANTAIFSLVNAVMLRPLPVADADALVFVGSRNRTTADNEVSLVSNPAWLQRIREETGIFTGVGAFNVRDFKVASSDGVELLVGQYASGNFHALVGVPMALGRGFASENDVGVGASPIAVISDKYWERRYQRNTNVLGSQLVVGGHPVTIVGVTAAGFDGMQPGRSIEVTLPLSIRAQDEPDFVRSLDSWANMPIVARLKAGVSAGAAEPIVDAAYREHMSKPGIGFGRTRDGRFMLSALFGITSRDPVTLAATTVVLGAIALAAAYVPARRAARVNPALALRAD